MMIYYSIGYLKVCYRLQLWTQLLSILFTLRFAEYSYFISYFYSLIYAGCSQHSSIILFTLFQFHMPLYFYSQS